MVLLKEIKIISQNKKLTKMDKKKILLFRPRYSDNELEGKSIPWGLLYLGSYLEKKGYMVKIIDEIITSNWEDVVLKELKEAIVCGVTSMTGKQIKYALLFSQFVRDNSNVPIVWGGIHPSILPKQTLKHPLIDFIVMWEGEETFLELVKAIETDNKFKDIPGIGFKEEKKIIITPNRQLVNLDIISDINYDLIDIEKYIYPKYDMKRSFEVCTSRGCTHKCFFCYNSCNPFRDWRSMSVHKIIDNFKKIVIKYNIDGINWREDNFFINKKRVEAIAKGIIKSKLNIKWAANSRIDYTYNYDDDFIRLLKKSGLSTIHFGVESGSDKILKSINKGITVQQVLAVKDKLTKHKVYQDYSFMVGFPNETKEDIKKTIRLIVQLANDNDYLDAIYGLSIYTPYPNTILYKQAVKSGFKPPTNLEGWVKMDWWEVNLPWIENKKWIENVSWNIRALNKKFGSLVYTYFLFKLFLLDKLDLNIPCFEKVIYNIYNKIFK